MPNILESSFQIFNGLKGLFLLYLWPYYSPLPAFGFFCLSVYYLFNKKFKSAGITASLGLVLFGWFYYPRSIPINLGDCEVSGLKVVIEKENGKVKDFEESSLWREFKQNFRNSHINYNLIVNNETEWLRLTVSCANGQVEKYSLSRNDHLYEGHDWGTPKQDPALPFKYYYDDSPNHYYQRLLMAVDTRH